MLPFHEEVKQNTIGVTKKTNAKQPHYKGLVLSYLVENEIVIYTSCQKVIRMWFYNQGQQKPRWEDLKTSNAKTQAHVNDDRLEVKEGIGTKWSCGFRLDGWMFDMNVGDELIFEK
jgi:hypothetical protein